MEDNFKLPAKFRNIRTIGTTTQVLTLEGLMALRNDLKAGTEEQVAKIRVDYKDAYFRDNHGSLRRVFSKRG